MDSQALYQAAIRAGRTLGAALISSAIVVLPQVVGVFELEGPYTTGIIFGLTAILNGIGKYLRGPTEDVSPSAGSDKLPI